MSAVEERDRPPDACERFGVAVNSKNLGLGERSWAADRIIEVAVATSVMLSRARSAENDAAIIAAELSPLLWRLKAGGEDSFKTRAAVLFAMWMVDMEKFKREHEQWIFPFAERVIWEHLHGRCPACRGCGQQERMGKTWSAPRGLKMLSPKLRPCQGGCGGSGQGAPRPHEQAQALGITMAEYKAGAWERRFRVAHRWLDRIARRLYGPLHSVSGRSSIRV